MGEGEGFGKEAGSGWIWEGRVCGEMDLGRRYVGEGCGFGEENGLGKRDGLWRGEVWEEDGLEEVMGFTRKMV